MSGTDAQLPPRLVLLPGLGVDRRVFYPQAAAFPDVLIPEWLTPEPRESLAHYAERLAALVRTTERGPAVVGGLSIGGMLALEMSRHLDARAVVLIASCRSPRAVCSPLRLVERIGRWVPDAIVRAGLPMAKLLVGRGGVGGGLSRDDRRLLGELIMHVPVPFLRWGGRAIMEWPGAEEVAAPVHHIHGDHDWVIPLRCVKPTVVVPGGSHVLNLSHPGEVNRLLREVVGG